MKLSGYVGGIHSGIIYAALSQKGLPPKETADERNT